MCDMIDRRNFIKELSLVGFLGMLSGKPLVLAADKFPLRAFGGNSMNEKDPSLLRGPLPIISTPFLESGQIDYDALGKEARFMIECGCAGAIWPQSEDSYDLLTNGEKKKGIDKILQATKRLKGKAVIGCQGNDKEEMLDFAEYIEKSAKKYNDNVVIISRPPDKGKTEDDLIDYYTALGNAVTHPVIIQTGGGERYRGIMPSVKMLVEIAKRFPKTFGYIKEESGNASSRIVEEVKEKPFIKTVFSAMGGSQWLFQGRKLGSEGLITERPAYADLVAYIWRQMENGDENGTLDDAFSKLLLMINAETIFPGESLRTGMRCPHIYLLKKRGIFKNCISRAWEIKDGHRVVPETPIVVDMEMTSEQQDEVEKRFESLKPYLNNLQI